MKNGKKICETLKQIRLDIARANEIEYSPCECNHEGDCAGTCPACDSELMFLESEIAKKRSSGKIAIVGICMGLASLSFASCSHNDSTPTHLQGSIAPKYVIDSIEKYNNLSELTDTSEIKNEPTHE